MIATTELEWRFGTIELPAADRYIRAAIDLTGEYSGAEIDLYQSLLRPGDVAVDVGANVGVFSIAMGLAVGPAGQVIAFEPQPPIFGILERNLARHGLDNVKPHRSIVSDRIGTASFVDIRSLPKGKILNFGAIGTGSRINSDYGDLVATPMTSIDALELERCSLIKIDVEGAEEAVIAAARVTIERCRPIVSLECDRPNAELHWIDGLLAADYRLWRFRAPILRAPNPKSASIDGQPVLTSIMVVAVPGERRAELPDLPAPAFQALDGREHLERLSRGIVVHRLGH